MLAIDIDVSEVEAAFETIDRELCRRVTRAVAVAAQDGADEARRVIGHTHVMRDQVHAEPANVGAREASYDIVSPHPASSFVNDGTPPHVIEAKNAKALRFEMNGELVFAKRVNHPGTQPQPFMDRAERVADRALNREIQVAVDEIQRLIG